MDDREFSSQVCYLNFDDNIQPASSESGRCNRCNEVVAACEAAYTGAKIDEIVYETTDFLEPWANTGCALCQLFLGVLPSKEVQSLRQYGGSSNKNGGNILTEYRIELPDHVPEDPADSSGNVTLAYRNMKSDRMRGDEIAASIIDIIPDTGSGLKDVKLGVSTGSKEATETSLEWLRACVSTHETCQRKVGFCPTRLVDVGSESQDIHLTLGATLPLDTEYLTLSHCWGGKVPFLLLENNLGDMLKEIRFDSLPRTFQDAIVTTRSLGKRYIWIDSLCIVQDDLEDWRRESSQMRKVYSMSWCNIAATAASDSSQGLFADRPDNPVQQLRIKFKLQKESSWYCFRVQDARTWAWGVQKAPLNERAWFCQERFLSPCNLHFSSNQLFWECRELTASELSPGGFRRSLVRADKDAKQLIAGNFRNFNSNYQEDHTTRIEKLYQTWNYVVGIYSASKLTFERDKLEAISGLAAEWAITTQDQYVAGLWRSDLPRQLLWRTWHPEAGYGQREYTAPSWSWAATSAKVRALESAYSSRSSTEPSYESLIEIIDSVVDLTSGNLYGAVKSGSLTLKGSLAMGAYQEPDRSLGYRTQKNLRLIYSANSSGQRRGGTTLDVFWDMPEENIRNLAHRLLPSRLYVLPIVNTQKLAFGHSVHGLILSPTENCGVFERVGEFDSDHRDHVLDACKYFDQGAEKSGIMFEEDGEGCLKYTITII